MAIDHRQHAREPRRVGGTDHQRVFGRRAAQRFRALVVSGLQVVAQLRQDVLLPGGREVSANGVEVTL